MVKPTLIKELLEKRFEEENIGVYSRESRYIYMRSVYYKLCRTLCPRETFYNIGMVMCARKHATAMHGLNRFDEWKNQAFFKEYLTIYDECLRELNLINSPVDYENLKINVNTEKVVEHFKEKHLIMSRKYRHIINKQTRQLENFKSPIFDKMSALPIDDFKELETRINAFFQMNAMKVKGTKTKYYTSY